MTSQALMNIVEEAGGKLVDPATEAPPFQWEDDGTGDIAPSFPIVKIVQGVSKMPGAEKHIGEFWRSDTEAYYPEMVIVPLFQKETRALFGEGGADLECASALGHVTLREMP